MHCELGLCEVVEYGLVRGVAVWWAGVLRASILMVSAAGQGGLAGVSGLCSLSVGSYELWFYGRFVSLNEGVGAQVGEAIGFLFWIFWEGYVLGDLGMIWG